MTPSHRLRNRAEFLAMRKGGRLSTRFFSLEWRKRAQDETTGQHPRFGFTVTKKTGKSVVRNRIRRRLREAVRLAAPDHAATGHDYVLVGRPAALVAPFGEIVAELATGLDRAGRIDANPRPSSPKRARQAAPRPSH